MWIIQAVRSGDYLTLLIGLAVRALMVFGIMPIHEYAHGWAASRLGDPTALRSGRNTFNPAAHIDPIGALCIVLFGFGWAGEPAVLQAPQARYGAYCGGGTGVQPAAGAAQRGAV